MARPPLIPHPRGPGTDSTRWVTAHHADGACPETRRCPPAPGAARAGGARGGAPCGPRRACARTRRGPPSAAGAPTGPGRWPSCAGGTSRPSRNPRAPRRSSARASPPPSPSGTPSAARKGTANRRGPPQSRARPETRCIVQHRRLALGEPHQRAKPAERLARQPTSRRVSLSLPRLAVRHDGGMQRAVRRRQQFLRRERLNRREHHLLVVSTRIAAWVPAATPSRRWRTTPAESGPRSTMSPTNTTSGSRPSRAASRAIRSSRRLKVPRQPCTSPTMAWSLAPADSSGRFSLQEGLGQRLGRPPPPSASTGNSYTLSTAPLRKRTPPTRPGRVPRTRTSAPSGSRSRRRGGASRGRPRRSASRCAGCITSSRSACPRHALPDRRDRRIRRAARDVVAVDGDPSGFLAGALHQRVARPRVAEEARGGGVPGVARQRTHLDLPADAPDRTGGSCRTPTGRGACSRGGHRSWGRGPPRQSWPSSRIRPTSDPHRRERQRRRPEEADERDEEHHATEQPGAGRPRVPGGPRGNRGGPRGAGDGPRRDGDLWIGAELGLRPRAAPTPRASPAGGRRDPPPGSTESWWRGARDRVGEGRVPASGVVNTRRSIVPRERPLVRHEPVQDAAEGVDVHAPIHRGGVPDLLSACRRCHQGKPWVCPALRWEADRPMTTWEMPAPVRQAARWRA